jgi:hypothetical protein
VVRRTPFGSVGGSSLRSSAALRDQLAAALTRVRHTGLKQLYAEQRAYLDEFCAGADVRNRGRSAAAGGPVRAVPRPARLVLEWRNTCQPV